MNRERWIGLAVLLLVIGGFLVLKSRSPEGLKDSLNGEGVEIEERASEFAKQMGIVLPDDVDKAQLNDISGGSAKGLATKKYAESSFVHAVLGSLPDPESGMWYEGWLVRPDPFDVVYTGKLRQAKGGWVLDYVSGEDLSDHNQVVVTLEKVDDQRPEKHILEGEF